MEAGKRVKGNIECGRSMNRKFSPLAIIITVLTLSAAVLRAQEAPEPPDPQESEQLWVMNDGSAHLGVTLEDVTAAKAQELKLPAVAGAIVTHIQKDSAAAKAGIEAGDTITEFDSVRVRSCAELRRLIRETPPQRTVEVKVFRDGTAHILSAKLEAANRDFEFHMPEVHFPPINIPEIRAWGGHRARLGISAESLTPQLADYFGVKQGKGVLISEVNKGGAAEKAGLKAGDVITEVDGKEVGGVDELADVLDDKYSDDVHKVRLTIVRDHRQQTVEAELTPSQPPLKPSTTAAQPDFTTCQPWEKDGQRQLKDEMLSLQDELKNMRDFRLALRGDNEI